MGDGNGPNLGAGVGMVAALGLRIFTAKVIAAAKRNERLDQRTLDRLRQEAVVAVKNLPLSGIDFQDQATVAGQAVILLNQLIGNAIAEGMAFHE